MSPFRTMNLLLPLATFLALCACGEGGTPGGLAPPPDTVPPGVTGRECDTPDPAWIWCDDFEVDRLDAYFEFDDADGAFGRSPGAGLDGSTGMQVRFAAGQVGAGSLHLAFGRTPQGYIRPVDGGTTDYREVYWRVFLRYEPGWEGGGGEKVSRAFVFASPASWAQAMVAHLWSGGPDGAHLVLDPVRGTDEEGVLKTNTYNDFNNFTWLGAVRSETPLFAPSRVGEWQCIEAHVRLNSPGEANGVFTLWVDGKEDARIVGLNWLGDFDDYGLNAVFLENYWNDGAPRAQTRTFDNFVVSRERIGCAT